MSKALTTNQIIASAKRRAQIPTAQNTFKPEDFIALANEELQLGLVPSVLQQHEDFFLREEETPLVEGQTEYTIPYRAIGNKLRNVFYKDTNGNLYELTRVSEDDRADYQFPYTTNFFHAFRVKNNKIVLEPTLSGAATGSMLFVYYIRANDLVPDDEVGVITGINRTTGAITVSSLPKKFNVTTKYDFIQNHSPHVHLSIDVTAISINTVQIS